MKGGLRLLNADALLGMSAVFLSVSSLPLARQVSRCIYLTWDVLMDFYNFPSSPTRSALKPLRRLHLVFNLGEVTK